MRSVLQWAYICSEAPAPLPNLKCIDFLHAHPGYLIAKDQAAHSYQMMHTRHFLMSFWEIAHTPRPSAPAITLDEILALVMSDNFPFCLPITMPVFAACFLSVPSFTQEELCRCEMTQWSLSCYWCSSISFPIQNKLNHIATVLLLLFYRSFMQTFIGSVISTTHSEGNIETCDHDSPSKEKCLFFTREQLFL